MPPLHCTFVCTSTDIAHTVLHVSPFNQMHSTIDHMRMHLVNCAAAHCAVGQSLKVQATTKCMAFGFPSDVWYIYMRNWPMMLHLWSIVQRIWPLFVHLTKCTAQLTKCMHIWPKVAHLIKRCTFSQFITCAVHLVNCAAHLAKCAEDWSNAPYIGILSPVG